MFLSLPYLPNVIQYFYKNVLTKGPQSFIFPVFSLTTEQTPSAEKYFGKNVERSGNSYQDKFLCFKIIFLGFWIVGVVL